MVVEHHLNRHAFEFTEVKCLRNDWRSHESEPTIIQRFKPKAWSSFRRTETIWKHFRNVPFWPKQKKSRFSQPKKNLLRNQEKKSSLSYPKQRPNWMKQRPSSKETSGSGTRFELYLTPCPHHQQHCWQYQSVRHKAMNSPKRDFLQRGLGYTQQRGAGRKTTRGHDGTEWVYGLTPPWRLEDAQIRPSNSCWWMVAAP